MTVKRVTIGAKPVLVHRETDMDTGPADGFVPKDDAAAPSANLPQSEPEPASGASSSIEDWLRKGDAVDADNAATGAAASDTVHAEPVAEPARVAPAAEVPPPVSPAQPKGMTMPPMPPWAGIVGGAVAGALVALGVAYVMPQISPTTDLRLSPLFERVSTIETGLRVTGEQVGRLNNEISQTLDNQTAATTRFDEQTAEITGLKQTLSEDTGRVEPVIDVSSPVFAVALGQLRTTFYTGRPFEAELVNVYAIAGNSELFSGYLTELLEPARTGVPNAAELRRVYPSYINVAGLRIGDSSGYYQYGMSLVNRYIGLATEPYSIEEANLAATRADAQLAVGDVAGAVNTLRNMGPEFAVPMQPWMDAARNYLRTETAITEMTRVVLDKLREKIGKEMSGASAAEPAASEPAIAEPAAVAPSAGEQPAPEAPVTAPGAP